MKSLLLLCLFCLGYCTVLMEMTFDISPSQELPDGYKQKDAVDQLLASEHLLWLRYHHTLISDHPNAVPMRLALLGFKDISEYAKFQDETGPVQQVLFDQFWIFSRRVLWNEREDIKFPDHGDRRSETTPGGFVWQFKAASLPGKKQDFENKLHKHLKPLIDSLEKNPGFVEGRFYTATQFRHESGYMFMIEFLNMASLSSSVYENPTFLNFLEVIQQDLGDWHTLLLGPPSSHESPFFWQAKGNAPLEEEEGGRKDL